jgi:peptidoglycan/xylan/chitin deacetylase (PgdA/CDA1 family)
MVEDGHQVGSHGWSHANLGLLTREARREEMVKNERALANILGKYPTYMRPAYSNCTTDSGCLDDMASLGYHVITGTHDTLDWQHPNNLDAMKQTVDEAFRTNTALESSLIMLQQDIIEASATDLTEYIIEQGLARGYICNESLILAAP